MAQLETVKKIALPGENICDFCGKDMAKGAKAFVLLWTDDYNGLVKLAKENGTQVTDSLLFDTSRKVCCSLKCIREED